MVDGPMSVGIVSFIAKSRWRVLTLAGTCLRLLYWLRNRLVGWLMSRNWSMQLTVTVLLPMFSVCLSVCASVGR